MIAHSSVVRISIRAATVTIVVAMIAQTSTAAGPSPQALAAFHQYVAQAEENIRREESASDTFLGTAAFPAASEGELEARLRRGDIVVTSVDVTPVQVPGGLIHHWAGLVFIPQASISQLLAVLQNYDRTACIGINDASLVSPASSVLVCMPPEVAELAAFTTDNEQSWRSTDRIPLVARSASRFPKSQLGQSGAQPLAKDSATA